MADITTLLTAQTDVPTPPIDAAFAPVLPDDETTKRLEMVVSTYLSRAKEDPNKPEERARRWRKYIALDPPDVEPPWSGAPQVVTPTIREKTDGVRAQIQASLDQDPMFVVKPRSERAASIKGDIEELIALSMSRTDSRTQILAAVRDAVEVGTGHLKHVAYKGSDGSYLIGSKYVPFEDIYVYPSTNTRTNARNYFERYREAKHVILRNAELGIYDREKVEQMLSPDDEESMNEVEELWEVWIWFEGRVWEVRYSETYGILAARPSVWNDLLQRAPYDPIYIEPSQMSYWGDSIPQILEGLQEVADAAFNTEIASAQYKLAPPMFVRRSSPAYNYIKRHGGIKPGMMVPVSQDPRLDVYVPKEQFNPFSIQLLQLAGQMTEAATFSDMLVPGRPTGGRKTATEVQVLIGVGTLKLTNYYRNVVVSLNRHANTKWSLIAFYSDKLRHLASTDEFVIEVNGKESTTERQIRMAKLQSLLNPAFIQALQLAMQNPVLMKVLYGFIKELDLPSVEAAFEEMMQSAGAGMVGALEQAQPQAPGVLPLGVAGPGSA